MKSSNQPNAPLWLSLTSRDTQTAYHVRTSTIMELEAIRTKLLSHIQGGFTQRLGEHARRLAMQVASRSVPGSVAMPLTS